MLQTGYAAGNPPGGIGGASTVEDSANHAWLKKQYMTYLSLKNDEIKEQQNARRYYHGSQYTGEQIKALNKRRQPVVTYNRIGRKINAIIGLNERQKTDPKGFPRTPKHEDGAEVVTAVLRYVLDEQQWSAKSPLCGLDGAVDGIAGIELMLEQGDKGDVEVGFEQVDPSTFFYDPRSLKMDFSDARYMGTSKWSDADAAAEMFPDKEAEIRASLEDGSELTTNPDYENKWFSDSQGGKRVRIVDHWYKKGGVWRYCLYTGSIVLDEGDSPFRDEKGRSVCKYVMFRAFVDQDGDSYGFVRNMKSSQDEINQRRSKGLHLLNTRRIIIERGAQNIEAIRREAARPDGVIEYAPGMQKPEFDDAAKSAELMGQLKFLEDAKDEIENYGFNPALIGTGVDQLSGRAIQLQQQAGIAELGPYLLAFKGWKLRVYRAIWCAVQQFWTGERWIRVTDDDNLAQFFAINKLEVDPRTGQPALVNALGSLDVDIIIDEGPDTINVQQDTYDTLSIMGQKGQQVPPELIIELSPLPGSAKKKAMQIIQQSKQEAMQMQQPAMQLEMQGRQVENAKTAAEVKETEANTMLKLAQAGQAQQPEQMAAGPHPMETAAKVQESQASATLKMAQAQKTHVETVLLPHEMRQQEEERRQAREERIAFKRADMNQQKARP